MNKSNKCKNCQWYGKPYWSIINPCDSCPNENDNKTIVQIDGVPVFKEAITEEQLKEKSIFELTIEEKDKEIERLNNIINELEKELNKKIEAIKTIKDMLGENAKVVNPHIEILEKEYNYFLDKIKELKEGR